MDASGSDASTTDGATGDASMTDGATRDASPSDGGDLDGAAPSDAGRSDGSSPGDAGRVDGGAPTDGGRPIDGGRPDARVGTTCSVSVSPPIGTLATDFEFSVASNGTGCMARLDGTTTVGTPCVAMMTFAGSTFGVGVHTVELLVAAGPSGAAMCSATFEVTGSPPTDAGRPDAGRIDAGPTTTCAIVVTPPTGTTSTTFTADWMSNGTGCTLSVDGLSLGSFACTDMFSGPGSAIGPGTHVATLDVAAGPSGPRSCSDIFEVTGP